MNRQRILDVAQITLRKFLGTCTEKGWLKGSELDTATSIDCHNLLCDSVDAGAIAFTIANGFKPNRLHLHPVQVDKLLSELDFWFDGRHKNKVLNLVYKGMVIVHSDVPGPHYSGIKNG